MDEIIKSLVNAGLGGIVAALVLWIYRKDSQDNATFLRGINATLLDVVRDNTSSNRENAVSNVRLVTVIEALHRKLDRDSDSHS